MSDGSVARADRPLVRVVLPRHLRTLADLEGELALEVRGPVTPDTVLDALEVRCPMLRGTIRDHTTRRRRPLVRLFACQEDWSHVAPGTPLPEAVAEGREPLYVIGAMAGG